METQNKKEEESKSRVGYGVKIPFMSFEEVIETTKIVLNKAGYENSIDALSRVTGNSSSSSSFHKKVAALRNYGVFELDKTGYKLTELGKRIAEPKSFEEQANAIIESFTKQENLKKIWEAYKGKRLPQKEFLTNSIGNILNVPIELRALWADYFIEAAKYAGLLEERETNSFQVLSGYTPIKNNNDIKKEETATKSKEVEFSETPTGEKQKTNGQLPMVGLLDKTWGILNIKSISENRKAIIAIPEQLTQQDIESLKVLLKGIEVQLDGLKNFNE